MRKLRENEVLISEYRIAWKTGILNVNKLRIDWESPLIWTKRLVRRNENEILDTNGFSQRIGTSRITIFKYKNQLQLLLKGQLIEINEFTESELTIIEDKLKLSIKYNGKSVFEQIHKQVKSIISLENDPTPFVEAEDFDLRILIHSVLNDSERQKRIFTYKAST